MCHQVQFHAAEDRQSSHAGHEFVQELIVGTHVVFFSPSASGAADPEICSWKG